MIDEDRILEFFKKSEGFVSGEEISERLKISRSAVWKHIEKLRREGYDIVATPHLGYRLASLPDRLTGFELRWGLSAEIIGRKVFSYNETDSTNDTAYRLAMDGAPEGTVVVAEFQRRGKGRLGRRWFSPRKKGIYISIILRPNILPREVSLITLFSAISVARTISDLLNINARIRWPNDVLINDKKVSGVLTEMNGESDRVNFVICGIGVNVNTNAGLLPEGGTSLREEKGEEIDRLGFTKRLLENLDIYYKIFLSGGIKRIIEEHKGLSAIIGRRVSVAYRNQSIVGYAVNVDEEGALILRLDSGIHERVLAGDVLLLR